MKSGARGRGIGWRGMAGLLLGLLALPIFASSADDGDAARLVPPPGSVIILRRPKPDDFPITSLTYSARSCVLSGVTFRKEPTVPANNYGARVNVYGTNSVAVKNCKFEGVDLYVASGSNASASVTDCVVTGFGVQMYIQADNTWMSGNYGWFELGVWHEDKPDWIFGKGSTITGHKGGYGEVFTHGCSILDSTLHGLEIYPSASNALIRGNTINGRALDKTLYVSSGNNRIERNTIEWGGIEFWKSPFHDKDCNYNTVSGNTINGFLSFYFSHHNTVSSNLLHGNADGMFFTGNSPTQTHSSYNMVKDNRLEGPYHKIYVSGNHNTIYNNYISGFYETNWLVDNGVGNQWHTAKTPGVNIVGGPYLGGNYSRHYTGADADGDGLGDTPYNIPGTAGAVDALPLVGAGELTLLAGERNPGWEIEPPQGQPFVVTQIKLNVNDGAREEAVISAFGFDFHGDTSRRNAIALAGLFAADNQSMHNPRFLGYTTFAANRLEFNVTETIQPGDTRWYALAYLYRYEDEYVTSPADYAPDGDTAPALLLGGTITTADIVHEPAGMKLVGEAVTGYVKPRRMYITGLSSIYPAAFGSMIETTAEVLGSWSLYNEIMVYQQPAVLRQLGDWYLWIKDRYKVHLVSPYANQPVFKITTGGGGGSTAIGRTVCEVLDAYVSNGRLYWSRGLGYRNPYAYADLLFDGEVMVYATATAGNYKGFVRDVMTPLRAALGGAECVIISQFQQNGAGYYAEARVLTHYSTQRVLAALLGTPRVLEMAGRQLTINYASSFGENPAPSEQIFAWGRGVDAKVAADYDGDGLTDPAVYDADMGAWLVWLSGADYAATLATGMGGAGYLPVPGDYDGDGAADPAVYSAAAGIWQVWLSSRGHQAWTINGWGTLASAPAPADYDGDGRLDPALFDALVGLWRARLSSRGHAEISIAGMGVEGCLPVPADYDGDGKADPAVYNANGGTWCAWLSGNGYQPIAVSGWGASSYEPCPADYDGDGKADPAVVDARSGRRRVWASGAGHAPMDF